jgi:hypothetical protein
MCIIGTQLCLICPLSTAFIRSFLLIQFTGFACFQGQNIGIKILNKSWGNLKPNIWRKKGEGEENRSKANDLRRGGRITYRSDNLQILIQPQIQKNYSLLHCTSDVYHNWNIFRNPGFKFHLTNPEPQYTHYTPHVTINSTVEQATQLYPRNKCITHSILNYCTLLQSALQVSKRAARPTTTILNNSVGTLCHNRCDPSVCRGETCFWAYLSTIS